MFTEIFQLAAGIGLFMIGISITSLGLMIITKL